MTNQLKDMDKTHTRLRALTLIGLACMAVAMGLDFMSAV